MNLSSLFSSILVTSVLAVAGCQSPKSGEENQQNETEPPATIDLLVGAYTGSGSNGIYQLQFDPATGQLSDSVLLVKTTNPSYLAISKDRQLVYSVNETGEGSVSSFKWNHEANQLTQLSTQSTEGAHPCYVDLNASENQLAVANYSSGNMAVYTIGAGGEIQPGPQIKQHEGSGPVDPNQKGPHAHCAVYKGSFLYVVDLGIDKILAYPVAADGTLGDPQTALALEPGDGPRHLIFHPTMAMAFVVNELSSSVVSLQTDLEKGVFEAIDKKSTLPDGYTDKNADADIHITGDGKFLYASNRGHNSIAMFAVSDDGMLTGLGHEPVQGNWPRNFALSPDDNYLLVANQESNNIVVFKRDVATGRLSATGNTFTLSKPVCLKF